MKPVLFLVGVSTTLRLCGSHPNPPAGAPGATAPAMPPGMLAPNAMAQPAVPSAPPPVPAHGGFVAMLGAITTEVARLPDGRVAVFASDAAHAPVHASAMQVNVVNPDGSLVPVAMNFDATQNAYVGWAAGITAGTYPVQVWMVPADNAPVAQLTTVPIALTPPTGRALAEGGFNIPLGGGHGVHVGGRHGTHVH